MLYEKVATDPDGLALDDLTRQRTWAELADRITRIAHLLREVYGLRPDDHAALMMHNRVEVIELTLGAILAGIWLTPINHHLRPEETAYIIEDSDARVLFTDTEHETTVRQSAAPHIVLAGEGLDSALTAVSDKPLPPDGPGGATMIYTSGTTGWPKGVQRARPSTLGEALATGAAVGTGLGLDGSGPHLLTGPMYHSAPLMYAVYDLLNGAPVVIMPKWDAVQTLRLIQEYRIQHTHMVPTMFVRLLRLDEPTRQAFDRSSLHLVLHGAAPIAPPIKRRMIEWWGPILVEYWGATEGGVCTLVDSLDWLAHPGTVGRAMSNFEVFAVDDAGVRLPPGEPGVLYSRNRSLARPFEYYRDPDKTARCYLEPSIFTIGDVGRVDADGYVYLTDRASNMIISGGVNIYPAEIEQVLQQHPAVADVCVFGIPDDEWGETVKAAVELIDGHQASPQLERDILDFARSRLGGYKVPRSIDFEAELPRRPTGKLYTRLLRERYWKGQDKRI